jgi:membrane-associated phospholipid phosphatase
MKKLSSLVIVFNIVFFSFGQSESPYKLKTAVDLPVIAGGAGLSLIGLTVLRKKPHLDSAFVATLDPDDVNKFDRSATKNWGDFGIHSDIALYSSFLTPVILIADKHIKRDALKIGALYLETMAIMANAYTWGVSATKRVRPYVYNPEVPFELKLRRGTTNSFYAGHPAAAAASTFFAAKVFSDYHPDSKLRKYLWAAALIPPSIVAYYRYKDGQHFPTDIFVGIPLGAAIGIVIPHLHKIKNKGSAQLYPAPGGIGITYKFY